MAYAKAWVLEEAANRRAGTPPCKDCKDRKLACSGSCERYKEWKSLVGKIRREMIGQDKAERAAVAYEAERNHWMENYTRRKK